MQIGRKKPRMFICLTVVAICAVSLLIAVQTIRRNGDFETRRMKTVESYMQTVTMLEKACRTNDPCVLQDITALKDAIEWLKSRQAHIPIVPKVVSARIVIHKNGSRSLSLKWLEDGFHGSGLIFRTPDGLTHETSDLINWTDAEKQFFSVSLVRTFSAIVYSGTDTRSELSQSANESAYPMIHLPSAMEDQSIEVALSANGGRLSEFHPVSIVRTPNEIE